MKTSDFKVVDVRNMGRYLVYKAEKFPFVEFYLLARPSPNDHNFIFFLDENSGALGYSEKLEYRSALINAEELLQEAINIYIGLMEKYYLFNYLKVS